MKKPIDVADRWARSKVYWTLHCSTFFYLLLITTWGRWGGGDHPLSLEFSEIDLFLLHLTIYSPSDLRSLVSAQFRVSYQIITPSILNFTSWIEYFWVFRIGGGGGGNFFSTPPPPPPPPLDLDSSPYYIFVNEIPCYDGPSVKIYLNLFSLPFRGGGGGRKYSWIYFHSRLLGRENIFEFIFTPVYWGGGGRKYSWIYFHSRLLGGENIYLNLFSLPFIGERRYI